MSRVSRDQYIFGRHPVIEAIDSGQVIEKIWLLSTAHGEFEIALRQRIKDYGIPVQKVPKEKLEKIIRRGQNHQGVIALLSAIPYHSLEDIILHQFDLGNTPRIAVLDGITDVRNMGAIARSAEFFGVHGIAIASKNSAPITALAIKSSAGALLNLPIHRSPSVMQLLDDLQALGVQLLGLDGDADARIEVADWSKPSAIILGAEGRGISREVKERLDGCYKIHRVGDVESLNVSVAAGVAFYLSAQAQPDALRQG